MLITLHAQKHACAYQLRVIINEYYVVEVDVVWDHSSKKMHKNVTRMKIQATQITLDSQSFSHVKHSERAK